MNYQFNFAHFKPDDDLLVASRLALEDILEIAPSDAVPVGRLLRRRDGFEATVEIFSKAGYFVARAFETTPKHALEAVKSRIERKLRHWKRIRFIESDIWPEVAARRPIGESGPAADSGGRHEKQVH
ncbi:MAG TPA: hypothetical protein VFV50_19270 [Bdellovibrionales bacterium]|nr:hypothetical protein [Bdellovibrionales bacterium]